MEEMAQVENLYHVNRSVEDIGATHVLNIKVLNGSKVNNLYTMMKDIIAAEHTHNLVGNLVTIRWACRDATDSSAYFWTVLSPGYVANVTLLAHTRLVVRNLISQVNTRLQKNPEQLANFAECEFVYSVTQTIGVINRLSIRDLN
jgi:hypothetical protein